MHGVSMSPDWVARGIAAASVGISLTSLAWAVVSWRRAGPSLRSHAIAYGNVLVVRVFNSGRTTDWMEQAVLGGRSGGVGGMDLTGTLSLPMRLEPGGSKRWEIELGDVGLARWPASIAGGWSSLWILCGSMTQHRAEVIPSPRLRPPTVGWQLTPRRSKASRYLPLLGAVAIAAASEPDLRPWSTMIVVTLGMFVVVRGFWAWSGSRPSSRRRVERWVLSLGWMLSVVALSSARRLEPPWAPAVLVSYSLIAMGLAVPGVVPQVGGIVSAAKERLALLGKSRRSATEG